MLLAQVKEVTGSSVDWANTTQMHGAGLAAVLLGGLAVLLVPRRHAILPIILVACFIAPGQRLVVGGLDFNVLRLLVLFGWLRLGLRREFRGTVWCTLDSLTVASAIVGTLGYVMQQGSFASLINRLGYYYDAIGMYFLFRCLIRSWADVWQAARWFAVVSVPVLGFFMIERSTGRNLFAFLGGVPEFTVVRGTRMRCQGAFAHPILAGCFWASTLPLMGTLWLLGGRARQLAVVGVLCSLAIIVLCASSTPVSAVLFATFGAAAYFVRRHLRWILTGAAVLAVLLHFAMRKPIWHLIARIDVAGGSTGWHRYHLIDQAIHRIDEWWLIGTRTTGHWGDGLQDVTNQYILDGVRGGILGPILLIATILLGFMSVSRIVSGTKSETERRTAWALGVCLFVHALCFISVSYFGQIIVPWYLSIAMIASMASWSDRRVPSSTRSSSVVFARAMAP